MVCICKINVQLQLQKTDRRNYKLITTTHKAKKYEEYNLVPNYHQCCNIEHSRWVSFKIQSQCSGSLMEKILIFTAKCAAPSLIPKETKQHAAAAVLDKHVLQQAARDLVGYFHQKDLLQKEFSRP